MPYHFKNRITHPSSSEIAEKVNYFADVFDFTLNNFHNPTFPKLENHRSILEKIKFQVDNYSEYSKKYVFYYLKSPFLTKKDELIKECYLNEWKKLNKVLSRLSNEIGDLKYRRELSSEISEFTSLLRKTLFEKVLEIIIRAILCKHPLGEHNHVQIFDYFTPLLVCEFLFEGFPEKYLRELFAKVLNDKIKLENGKAKTIAPLPENILKYKRNQKKFFEYANKYLENRTLKEQFEGIFHLFKNAEQKKFFVFKINGIKSAAVLNTSYNNVRFTNTLKNEYVKRGKTNKNFKSFFHGKHAIFAEVQISGTDDKEDKENAIRELNRSLDFFNYTLEKKASVDRDDYIAKGENGTFRHNNFPKYIYDRDIKHFQEENIFTHLKGKNSRIVKRFLRLDEIFYHAMNAELSTDKLNGLWRYVESFYVVGINNAEKIKSSIPKILCSNNPLDLEFGYFNIACPVLRAAHHDYFNGKYSLGISVEELHKLIHPGTYDKVDFNGVQSAIIHPYVNKKIKWFLSATNVERQKALMDSYKNTMFEIYEQRNLMQHNGIFVEKSVAKNLVGFEYMVIRFRLLLIKALKEKDYRSFKTIIKGLENN